MFVQDFVGDARLARPALVARHHAANTSLDDPIDVRRCRAWPGELDLVVRLVVHGATHVDETLLHRLDRKSDGAGVVGKEVATSSDVAGDVRAAGEEADDDRGASSETKDRPPTFTAPGGIVSSSPTSRRGIGSSNTHMPAAVANR
eukprot:13162991-Heterocapsa_arctica.AAC.1